MSLQKDRRFLVPAIPPWGTKTPDWEELDLCVVFVL
jgi:hypothetical protein